MSLLDEIIQALREEASDLTDVDPPGRPDWADVRVAAAFERLAANLNYRATRVAVENGG